MHDFSKANKMKESHSSNRNKIAFLEMKLPLQVHVRTENLNFGLKSENTGK